jgi:hypothetical protein
VVGEGGSSVDKDLDADIVAGDVADTGLRGEYIAIAAAADTDFAGHTDDSRARSGLGSLVCLRGRREVWEMEGDRRKRWLPRLRGMWRSGGRD